MTNSLYLPINLVEYALQNINRKEAINKLEEIIKCYPLAIEIESGIFEFALNYVTTQLLNNDNIMMIYQDKLFEILDNLDTNNKKINNQTLLPALYSGAIPGQTIPFLKMYQLHPQKWKHIIDKNNLRDDILYTVSTTDAYKCGRCGMSKHSYYITQTRSADEPATAFFTCINCKKTFTKSV
jgi:DNA-directed RNA polymerase subunit RPC12/RpoP